MLRSYLSACHFLRLAVPSCLTSMMCALPALAQDAPPALSIELNALDDAEAACRLVFLARNDLQANVSSLVLEAVAFDLEDGVTQISLFDFGELPVGLPRVRQFDLPERSCDDVGRVLINGVQTCRGAENCPFSISSRTDVELLG